MKHLCRHIFCLLYLFGGESNLLAQTPQVFKGIKSEVEGGIMVSATSTNPFWIRTNQNGEVPLGSQFFTLRGQMRKEYDSTRKFSYGYGLRAVMNAGKTNQLLISEFYGKIRYGCIELSGGRRREIIGLVDTLLSTGAYIWSGNALPVPKIQISIPNYTPILKNGLLAIKGNYAHGWFGTSDSIQNYFLHQKSFYVRIGKPQWRLKLHSGFNHQVQWGGKPRYVRYDTGVRITQFGTDLESYWYVITGRSLYSKPGTPLGLPNVQDGTKSAEGGNRVGNHLGTWDLELEYENEVNQWFFYRQSIYEDGSFFYLSNITDGLSGVSFRRKKATKGIQRVVFEYLQTSDQSGSISDSRTTNERLRGYDNYFNNGRYIDGWTYKEQTIGTPFIMPLGYTTGLSQKLDKNLNRLVNNRVKAFTLTVKSALKHVDLVTRLSVSRNLGNYDIPLDIKQVSIQQKVVYPVNKYIFTSVLAYDNFGILKRNLGMSLLVKRTF